MRTDRRPQALVTGGAGFLGSHVCESLLGEGYEVVCLDNFATGFLHNIETLLAEPRFTLLNMDIAQGGPQAGDFDVVVHLAASTSPFQYSAMPMDILRSGSEGIRHALETARRCRARFVLASSSHVYGDSGGNPQRENYLGSPRPIDSAHLQQTYDGSRFAEALTVAFRRTHHVDTGVVRIFNTYGPSMRLDDGGVVATFIQQALDGEPLTVTGDGSQTRSLCYVADTVEAILRMATSLHPGPINVGSPDEVTILDLARQITSLAGSSSTIRYVERCPADLQARRPDVTAALGLLGWQPRVSLLDGLRRTLRGFRLARLSHDLSVPAARSPDEGGYPACAAGLPVEA